MERISIIIPIYNGEKHIEKCLASMINQTYNNIEVIVINDGSTDKSLEIIDKIKKKSNKIVVINKENEGVSVARNIGMEKATGEYILFCDADDWFESNMVEILYNTIKEKKVDIVRCGYFVEENEKSSKTVIDNMEIDTSKKIQSLIIDLINGKIPAYIWLLIIKKSCLDKIEFDNGVKFKEDTIFYIKLLNQVNKLCIIDKPLYHYLKNENSVTNNLGINRLYQIIEANKYLYNELKLNKNYCDDMIYILNTFDIKNIDYVLYSLYGKGEFLNLQSEIQNLYKNPQFVAMIENMNMSLLSSTQRLTVRAIKNKKILYLKILYSIRRKIFGK